MKEKVTTWRKQMLASSRGAWLVGMIVTLAIMATACAPAPTTVPTAAPATAAPKSTDAPKPTDVAAKPTDVPKPTVAAAKPTDAPKPTTAPPPTAPPAKVVLRGGTQLNPVSVSWAPYFSVGAEVGWLKEENLEVQMDNLQTAVLLTLLTKGDAEFFIGAPEAMLGVEGQGTKTNIRFAYNYYTRPWYLLATTEDSPIKTIADLKGKTIGLSSLGAPQVPALMNYLREGGLKETDVTMVVVGNQVSAAQNLKDKQIDAMQQIANNFTIFENAGFKYRYFPMPAELEKLFGAGYYVHNRALSDPKLKDALGRYFRVVAKSVLFAKTNPEATVCIHWKVKPESKPKGQTDAKAMELGKRELEVAMQYAGTKPKTGRWGEYVAEMVRDYIAFAELSNKLKNPEDYYTNAFIETANNFNEAEVINFAKNYVCK